MHVYCYCCLLPNNDAVVQHFPSVENRVVKLIHSSPSTMSTVPIADFPILVIYSASFLVFELIWGLTPIGGLIAFIIIFVPYPGLETIWANSKPLPEE